MRIKLIIPISLLAAAVIFILLALPGCDPIKVEGPPLQNTDPWISWAITPSDSVVHSFNPILRWFGADQDGQINNYFYGVFQAAYLDSASRETSLVIPDTLTWVPAGNVTQARIPLVASPDSSVSVGQYVVLQAVDDQGSYSNIINRYLLRTNNRPTCLVTVPTGPQWVLPETTATWSGIPVSWEGGDSLDYSGAQPDFLWEVRVYGPYPDSATVHADTVNFDTAGAPLYGRIIDGDDDPYRINGTSFNFYSLVTGFYIICVRNFDDADVPSSPALGIIEVYEPHWIRHPNDAKDILFLNASSFNPVPGNLGADYADSVHQFYADLIEDAGIPANKWDWFESVPIVPDISDLYLYRIVVVSDLDWNADVGTNIQEPIIDYLDVGGKFWVIGRFSFFNTSTSSGLYQYQGNAAEPLPFAYLGLDAAYYPPANFTDAEFVGARVIQSANTGLSDLEIDTLKIQALNGSFDYAFPKVERLITGATDAKSIYTFNAISPDSTGTFHGFPVAVRLETSTFKSSYFSFPLYFIKYDQASDAFSRMIAWFLED
jgi:hypothetical protein